MGPRAQRCTAAATDPFAACRMRIKVRSYWTEDLYGRAILVPAHWQPLEGGCDCPARAKPQWPIT